MATQIGTKSRNRSKPSRPRKRHSRQTVHKPNGELGPRVKKVGVEKFAIVCIDPAKHRSEWMMADYLGNLLIAPNTLEHRESQFQAAVQQVRQSLLQHKMQDVIVTIERTGNYHLGPQRAFRQAGFETRVVHPFATKQYRLPADAGNKTDQTDLFAQHRAVLAGFGLREFVWDETSLRLQLRIRHRRDLTEKASAIASQMHDHLHLVLPGYAQLFADLFRHPAAMAIARFCPSPQAVLQQGATGLARHLRKHDIRFQTATLDKILAWAQQTQRQTLETSAGLHHAIWIDLDDLHQSLRKRISVLEREIASDLVRTPYVRLLTIPGIHVVSAADFAGEMGPIGNYANANAITGRSGLFPSRYQSDQTDLEGHLVKQCNRRLRATLMRIADNLVRFNAHFRGLAGVERMAGLDERRIRVKAAKKFSRIAFAAVAGDQPLRHPCAATSESILSKLQEFHLDHGTAPDVVLTDLEATMSQLLPAARQREAAMVREVLEQSTTRRRGPQRIGSLLVTVLARYGLNDSNSSDSAPPLTPDSRGSTAPS